MQKRFQFIAQGGEVRWTQWFTVRKTTGAKQMGRLKNQYRNEQDAVQ